MVDKQVREFPPAPDDLKVRGLQRNVPYKIVSPRDHELPVVARIDIDDCRKLDFPVFARTHTARTARGRIVEVATNEPITVGEVTVTAGDYVVADGSAVVFVAQNEIERVLDTAEAIVEREEAMAQALREGNPISKVMGANYESMLKK